jgi:hypothetical protein
VSLAGDSMTGQLNVHNSTQSNFASSLAESVSRATVKLRTHSTDSTLTTFGGISGGDAYIQRSNGSGTSEYDIRLNPFGGRVLMPNQPAFYAMMNNTTFTSTQAIIFEDVYVNRGSHYNPANGRFTAPVAGTYHFSANFLKRSGAGRLLFHKNDVYYGSGNSQVYQGTTSEIPMAATIIITLAVNDYINVIGQIDSGDIYGNANSHNGFSGFLIG